jgi:hypothetical protein
MMKGGIPMRTLLDAIERFGREGFTDSFWVVDDGLRTLNGGKLFAPNDVMIRDFARFEGVSDPDDMAIVYAIESRGGARGTLVDAFGVYSSPLVADFLDDVPTRKE